MNGLVIICFIVWIYILTVLSRSKLRFWKFLVGSVGLFLFMMIWLQPILTVPLSKMVAAIAGIMGNLTGLYDSYFQYGMLFIDNSEGAISLYVDYECSGIIEIMAFSALLWFFPVYQLYEKIIVNIAGALFIIAANVLRIFVICLLIHQFGNDMYFMAHTIFGRIIFYGFSVVLYFYVFTRSQVIRQKVGHFKYGNH